MGPLLGKNHQSNLSKSPFGKELHVNQKQHRENKMGQFLLYSLASHQLCLLLPLGAGFERLAR